MIYRDSPSVNMDRNDLQKRIKNMLSDPLLESKTLEKMKKKYLMADDPRNLNRFGFTVEELSNAFKARLETKEIV